MDCDAQNASVYYIFLAGHELEALWCVPPCLLNPALLIILFTRLNLHGTLHVYALTQSHWIRECLNYQRDWLPQCELPACAWKWRRQRTFCKLGASFRHAHAGQSPGIPIPDVHRQRPLYQSTRRIPRAA